MKQILAALAALWCAVIPATALTDNEALNSLIGTQRLTDNQALNYLAVNGPTTIKLRRDTAANWTSENPVLAIGEVGVELSSDAEIPHRLKVGDGETAWTALPYQDDLASAAEAIAGTNGRKFITPETLKAALDAAAFEAGSYLLATQLEAEEGTGDNVVLSPVAMAQFADYNLTNQAFRYTRNAIYDCAFSAAPQRLMIGYFGDSVRLDWGTNPTRVKLARTYKHLAACWWPGVKSNGDFFYVSPETAPSGAVVFATGQWTKSASGNTVQIPAGQSFAVQAQPNATSTNDLPTSYRLFDKITICYVKQVGGATAKFGYRDNGTSGTSGFPNEWTYLDVPGSTSVDTSIPSGLDFGTVTITFPAPVLGAAIKVENLSASGNVELIGAKFENTTVNGYGFADLGNADNDLDDNNTIDPDILAGILGVIQPTLISLEMTGDNDWGTGVDPAADAVAWRASLDAWDALWATAWPAADRLIITPSPEDTGERPLADQQLLWAVNREFAYAHGYGYFSLPSLLRSWAWVDPLAWNSGTIHLTDRAKAIVADGILRYVGIVGNYLTGSAADVAAQSVSADTLKVGDENIGNTARYAQMRSWINGRGITTGSANGDLIVNTSALTPVGTGGVTLETVCTLGGSTTGFSLRAGALNTSSNTNWIALARRDATTVKFEIKKDSATSAVQRLYTIPAWLDQSIPHQWVGVRYDDGSARAYVDGVELQPDVSTDMNAANYSWAGTVNTSYLIHVAGGSDSIAYEEALVASALTPDQIRAWFEKGISPVTPAILRRYTEQAGARVADWSGNGKESRCGGVFTWAVTPPGAVEFTTASVKLVSNSTHLANNNSLRVVAVLPSTPQRNDWVELDGMGSAGWKVSQPANTQILTGAGDTVGTNATTSGTSGYIQSGARYDTIRLRCIVSDAVTPSYVWAVVGGNGTWTWN